MSPSDYTFTPLCKTDARGAADTIGHAIIWDPRLVRMELIVSHETLARDCYTKTFAPYYRQINPRLELEPLPGMSVREAIAQCPGGVAYFNAGESGVMINPLIHNGQLLTKTGKSRALGQKEWEPLNDAWTFFLQHADPFGRAEIRDLRIAKNQIHPDDTKYLLPSTDGFSVPHILKRDTRSPNGVNTLTTTSNSKPKAMRLSPYFGNKTRERCNENQTEGNGCISLCSRSPRQLHRRRTDSLAW